MRKALVTTLVLLLGPLSIAYADTGSTDTSVGNSNVEQPAGSPTGNQNLSAPTTGTSENIDPNAEVSNTFNISVNVGAQSAWSKKVPLEITVTSTQDTDRAEIRIDSRTGLEVFQSYEQYVPLKAGVPTVFRPKIRSLSPGTYNITVNAVDWNYGRNYSSSESITLTFDDDQILSPKQASYRASNVTRILVLALVWIIVLGISVFLLIKLFRFLQEWLKPPQD